MKYVVRSRFLESTHEDVIDIGCFNMLKRSSEVLTSAFQIEHIFDNLISNYLEVENRCFGLTARRLVRQDFGYREGNEALSAINLVFVNYLSTARAYVDKIGSAASRCFSKAQRQETKERVKALLAEQYNLAFDYRFMEALRNHVQHNGSAVHTLRQGFRRMKVDQCGIFSESFLEPLCDKNSLVQRGDFKALVLAECPDQVNLLKATRAHVRALSHIQRTVRDFTSAVVAEAAAQIKAGQNMLEGKVTGSLDCTEAASLQKDGEAGEAGETVPLLLNWEEVRSWLVQRNPGVPDGIATYPSGRGAL